MELSTTGAVLTEARKLDITRLSFLPPDPYSSLMAQARPVNTLYDNFPVRLTIRDPAVTPVDTVAPRPQMYYRPLAACGFPARKEASAGVYCV